MATDIATLPRTLTLSPSAPRVRMTAGAGSVGQKTWNLRRPITLIGSQRAAQIVLNDDSVSKSHCVIVNTGSAVLLRDLNSRTGTRCNDKPVDLVLLSDGDVLHVGPTTVQVAINSSDLSAETGINLNVDDPLIQPTPPTLTINGPDGRSRTVTIEQSTALIGRSPSSAVCLESDGISLAHALIFVFEGRPAICDLGSRAGLTLNGAAESLAPLNEGDLIQLGPYSIKVHFADARPALVSPDVVPQSAPPPHGPEPVNGALSLHSLEEQMAATWARWNDWQGSIRQSAALLQSRQQELLQRGAELDGQDAKLRGQLHDLELLRAELLAREGTLRTEREQHERSKTAWEQSQAAAQIQLEKRRRELDTMTVDLDRRRAELETLASEAAAREAKLNDRGTQLDVRQVKLEQRERRVQEMERVMGQLQTMLGQFPALDADVLSSGSMFVDPAPRPKPTPS